MILETNFCDLADSSTSLRLVGVPGYFHPGTMTALLFLHVYLFTFDVYPSKALASVQSSACISTASAGTGQSTSKHQQALARHWQLFAGWAWHPHGSI